MNDFTARKPDYNVAALDKNNDAKGNIGVGWKQPNGSIRIKLNSFVVLDTRESDFVITLFPINAGDNGPKYQGKAKDNPTEEAPY